MFAQMIPVKDHILSVHVSDMCKSITQREHDYGKSIFYGRATRGV